MGIYGMSCKDKQSDQSKHIELYAEIQILCWSSWHNDIPGGYSHDAGSESVPHTAVVLQQKGGGLQLPFSASLRVNAWCKQKWEMRRALLTRSFSKVEKSQGRSSHLTSNYMFVQMGFFPKYFFQVLVNFSYTQGA